MKRIVEFVAQTKPKSGVKEFVIYISKAPAVNTGHKHHCIPITEDEWDRIVKYNEFVKEILKDNLGVKPRIDNALKEYGPTIYISPWFNSISRKYTLVWSKGDSLRRDDNNSVSLQEFSAEYWEKHNWYTNIPEQR